MLAPTRRWLVVVAAALLPSAAWSQGEGPAPEPTQQARTHVVQLTPQLRFEPERLVVRAGDTVVFTNRSQHTHTVTADPSKAAQAAHSALPQGAEPFDSGPLRPGAEYSRTFEVPGTYHYFCRPHELAGMTGELVVLPEEGS